MSGPGQPRVFISYARKDGAALAQRLQASLHESGFDVWLDTQRISGGAVWSTEVEREIDSREVTLALLSPGSYSSEICRAEQLRALDKGNRVIPVMAVKGADRPIYLYAKQFRDFTDDTTYSARLAELLSDIRGDATATLPDAYRQTRITYLTAPPRVANYLERREALDSLRNAVFAEDQRQPIALTALAGMGGIGKTVLAKALTDDEVVQRAFPDGIVWITAGRERKRDFMAEMREVAKALGDDLSGYDNPLACENQYRTTIASKAALIVVDDVWSKADIEPLLAESPRSRFLFTTRDVSIGRFVSAREHRADLLDVAQSRELLASWADMPAAQLPAVADEMVHQCGRLPLALSVVGGMLRGSDLGLWTDTLDLLRKADLSAIQEQLPPGQQSFFKAVEVSFQSLEPATQERYKRLAVLVEDMAAPLPLLETLWQANAAEARRISRVLVDRSLAQRDGVDGNIRLHDLQLDYVRAQWPQEHREALDLIHGGVRLSSNVITNDPAQFASQIVGRLLSYFDMPAIAAFTERVVDGTRVAWLRSLTPALHRPGTGLLWTITGHSASVNGVAVTPDGELLVSASADCRLKVWDLRSGTELRTLAGHTSLVNAVAVTSDGRRVVSASYDKTLKVWDLASGNVLHTLCGHSGSVNGVAVTQDGLRAVSASQDNTLKVWDLESGSQLLTLTGHSNPVAAVTLTRDGKRAVSASWDRTLKLWDLVTGSEIKTLTGHSGLVMGVALTPDEQRVVSASYDQTLKVWELESGRELRTLTTRSGVTAVAVTPDGRLAVSASWDKTLSVWDLASGRELRTLSGHSGWANALAVTPDGQLAVSAAQDATLMVWGLTSTRDSAPADTPPAHASWVTAVTVTPDGQRVVSASRDNTLKVWDLATMSELRTLRGHSNWVNAVRVTPDGQRLVSTSYDKTLKVWDLESGRELRTLSGHTNWVSDVALTPDGHRAVSASSDKTLKLWDLESGDELCTLTGHSANVTAVAVLPDGLRVISASWDRTLKLWELQNGSVLRTLSGHSHAVTAVAVTPDGRRVVSASADRTLKVWDLDNMGILLRTLAGHSGPVNAVAVTPDGQRVLSASADQTLKVWDLPTGEVVATFTSDSIACCCAYSDALKLIVAGDAGGHLHFLRLEEPKKKDSG